MLMVTVKEKNLIRWCSLSFYHFLLVVSYCNHFGYKAYMISNMFPPNVESPPLQPAPDSVDALNERIGKLQPGRLSMTCIQAANLRRKDKNQEKTSLSLWIQFTLGQNSKKQLVKKSKTHLCESQSPLLYNEFLSFDIQEPIDIICHDTKDIKLKIEVFDQASLKSIVIGEATLSAMRFFNGEVSKEWIPLLQNNDKTSNSSIYLQFVYTPVKEGMLMLTLRESKKLKLPNTDIIPYKTRAVFTIGDKVLRKSAIVQEEFGNPTYCSEVIYLDVNKENWFDAMNIYVLHITSQSNNKIGEQMLDILPLMNKILGSKVTTLELPLITKCDGDNKDIAGILVLQAEFLHSSRLNIKIVRAKSLMGFDDSAQKCSPYIIVRSEGRSSCHEYRTTTIREGGASPIWDENFSFAVVDHKIVNIQCYEDDFLTNSHQLIGSGQLSLIPAYRTGKISNWVSLTRSNGFGGTVLCGQVNIEIEFEDVGSLFPRLHESTNTTLKHHESCTVYDDSLQPLAPEIVKDIRSKDDTGEEFSDEEIRSTFAFLDLDKNGYIGASELRHVLINMGELITDEEVDTMISFLDKNGDGQVNFQQFEAMARSSSLRNNDSTVGRETQKSVNNMRKNLFLQFIINNKITKSDVRNLQDCCLQRHRAFASKRNQDIGSNNHISVFTINYQNFLQLLPIEPTGESEQVFALFVHDKDNVIDLRELTISLCNFIGTFSLEEKCSMVFELFDGDRDYIVAEDMKVILAGTHLKHFKELTRKVQTILKFVDKEGTNKISQEIFYEAALKFPNLLMPKVTA